jgi:DMSO reductase iron-sulfur subunit
VTVTEVVIGRKPFAGIAQEGPERLALDAGEHYRFGFDMNACIGCHSCEVACAEQNGLPAGTTWRRVGEIEGGDHPTTRRFNLSMSCNHCLEPACLQGCPTNAFEKLGNGLVVHHADDCIGCQYCTWNCPYSVPVFQPDRRIVTKCDMCRPRLEGGIEPACVAACPTHAITVEKVRVDEWRADHRAADAPELPSSDITISTTRITLPRGVPADTYAASDWNVRPEHPHWPLVWLTLLSQECRRLRSALYATAAALGPVLTGRAGIAVAGVVTAVVATALNWLRLARHGGLAWRGALRLELGWHRHWTASRLVTAAVGIVALGRGNAAVGFVALAVSELVGRWLFYVTVVPMNMPGAFWRSAAGSHR